MAKTLVKNARLVNDGRTVEGDLLIDGERIARVGGDIPAADAAVIDARGLCLMPGMIDDQVHFREPGLTYKADLETESAAAVAGGITTFMDMPNTQPQTVTIEALEAKFALAAGREDVHYKCGWSPLEGQRLRSRVVATFVNGRKVYEGGRFAGEPAGQRLQFAR